MWKNTHEPAPAAQKNIVIRVIIVILAVMAVTAMVLLYMQNKNIKSLKQTVVNLENQLAAQKTESQPAPSTGGSNKTEGQSISGSISFDGCGALSKYQNEAWYPELAKNTTLTKESLRSVENAPQETASLQDVKDACFSKNGNLFIILIPGGYAQGPTIYRFDTKTYKLEKATLRDNGRGWLASPDEFGQREGNIIHLEGINGDAGAGSKMFFDYNFVKNIVELKKEYNYSADDRDNGEWHYY